MVLGEENEARRWDGVPRLGCHHPGAAADSAMWTPWSDTTSNVEYQGVECQWHELPASSQIHCGAACPERNEQPFVGPPKTLHQFILLSTGVTVRISAHAQ